VVVIPNGVPAATLAAEPPAAPTVLYAGRLRARKAPVVLVRAFAAGRRAPTDARLVLAGDGDERPAVEREIARLGLGERVERLGSVPRAEVAERLRRASVFCLPSLYEGLPLALLEAMAAGVPVVATAVSGHPDAIVDGVGGWLVPAEDSAALASALVGALGDPAEAQPPRRRGVGALRRALRDRGRGAALSRAARVGGRWRAGLSGEFCEDRRHGRCAQALWRDGDESARRVADRRAARAAGGPPPPHAGGRGGDAPLRREARRGSGALGSRRPAARLRLGDPPDAREPSAGRAFRCCVERGCPEPVVQAILAHNEEGTGVARESALDFALLACDEVTGCSSPAPWCARPRTCATCR
jgi:hypothetical protein